MFSASLPQLPSDLTVSEDDLIMDEVLLQYLILPSVLTYPRYPVNFLNSTCVIHLNHARILDLLNNSAVFLKPMPKRNDHLDVDNGVDGCCYHSDNINYFHYSQNCWDYCCCCYCFYAANAAAPDDLLSFFSFHISIHLHFHVSLRSYLAHLSHLNSTFLPPRNILPAIVQFSWLSLIIYLAAALNCSWVTSHLPKVFRLRSWDSNHLNHPKQHKQNQKLKN